MPYRFEYASTGRAGCKATACKKAAVKIGKGELRTGTWVEIQDHASWQWRHWGCITPTQIGNIKDFCDNDASDIEGYEDLTDEDKTKVRQALADGHVADEDLTEGIDPEVNRDPNVVKEMKRQQKEADKEKKKAEKDAETTAKAEAKQQEKADKAAAKAAEKAAADKKKKASDTKVEEGSDMDEKSKVTKKRSRVKQDTSDDEEENEEAPVAKPRKRSKVKNEPTTAVKHESSEEEAPATISKKNGVKGKGRGKAESGRTEVEDKQKGRASKSKARGSTHNGSKVAPRRSTRSRA